MLNKLVEVIKKIPNVVDALGINLSTDNDNINFEVAGNKINASIKDGKLRGVSVAFDENPADTVKKVTDAVGGVDHKMQRIPTSADVNPDLTFAIASYGKHFLFGGEVLVSAIVTDYDKYREFSANLGLEGNRWTQYMANDVLYKVVNALVDDIKGKDMTLIDLFNHLDTPPKHSAFDRVTFSEGRTLHKAMTLTTNWCVATIMNIFPEKINDDKIGDFDILPELLPNPLGTEGQTVGLVVGPDDVDENMAHWGPTLVDTMCKIGSGKNKTFVSFDVKGNSDPTRALDASLKLADTFAKVVYDTQLSYLGHMYNTDLPIGKPISTDIRNHYDKSIKELPYDIQTRLVKLELVDWN